MSSSAGRPRGEDGREGVAEDYYLFSEILGDAAGLRVGVPVRVVFERAAEDLTLPKFRLA